MRRSDSLHSSHRRWPWARANQTVPRADTDVPAMRLLEISEINKSKIDFGEVIKNGAAGLPGTVARSQLLQK